jgi:serine/threonine-protein kinase
MSASLEPPTLSSFRVLVLGPFTLERDSVAIDTSKWQRRVGSLFKLLATAPDRRRLRDEVIDVLWPDSAPEAGAGNLRIVAHRLRLALGGGEPLPVLSEHGWITLNPAYSWEVDLHQFEEMARLAGADVAALQKTVALYRGEPLLEERYEDWAGPIRERAQRGWRDLQLRLATIHQTHGSHEDAIRSFERVLEADPLDEEALRGLLTALYSAGRRTDALRRYQQFEQRLAEELGVPPSAETMTVVQQLHTQFADDSAIQQAESTRVRPLPIGGFLGALPDGPLLAREEELERILFAVDAVETGTGRLVLLSGEAGIGKTRLAQEVTILLRDRGFVVATGRCYEREQTAALHPFLEAVALAFEAAPPSVRAQVAKRWPALGQLLPELAHDQEEQRHLFRTVAGFLEAIAEERPLGLLLDDLHRADEASVDLVVHLARHTRGHRIFLLGTYRDGDIDRERPLGRAVRELAREGLVERVTLRRLSPEGTAALVNAAMGETDTVRRSSEEFMEFVHRRTKGNPFYIEKMLQALGGHYCLIRQIGAGGMGRVFEAVDTRTGEPVAAKIMFARTEADPKALLRFEQEGTVLASLDHPNIVQVHGTFLEEHANCIIMELLEGRSLGEILRQDGRIPFERIKRLTQQVAAALGCAHDHGVVHRDIKPDNIMVVGDEVKVTDFGIARLARPSGPLTTLTSTGMTMGTPLYMAPEQIEGKHVDGRADIYSLGAVLYQLVTGRPPFEGHDPLSIAFKHVHEAPTPPHMLQADVPEDWEALILKALAKDPADRFQTVAEMETAMDALGQEAGRTRQIVAPPTIAQDTAVEMPAVSQPSEEVVSYSQAAAPEGSYAEGERSRNGRRQRLWLAWGGAAVAAALLAAGTGFILAQGHKTTAGLPTALPAKTKSSPLQARSARGSGPGQFNGPTGVTVDRSGNAYTVDSHNNRVQEFSTNGTWLRQFPAGSRGPAAAHLNGPTNAAVGPDGTVFVTDYGNHRIVLYSPTGTYLGEIRRRKKNSPGFRSFNGLTIDGQGNLYVSDFVNDQVLKLSRAGTWLGQWGRPGSRPGQFSGPEGVAVDPRGTVYVSDTNNSRIQEFSLTGSPPRAKYLGIIGTKFGSNPGNLDKPQGVAIDRNGNVYVADSENDRIQEFSSTGQFLQTIGYRGTAPGQMIRPSSVAVDGRGNIYVAEFSNDRIEKFSPKGHVIWTTPGH